MQRFDAGSAECLVFTYKEGLLSVVAHDLKIRATRFRIEVDEVTRSVDARFDAGSLRVVCAMSDETEAPGALSAANKREIEANIIRDVLEVRAYPDIQFVSTKVARRANGYRMTGTLTLHGMARAVSIPVEERQTAYVATARIHQPDFGIRPYTALLGALKVKPDVTVRVTLPRAADDSRRASG